MIPESNSGRFYWSLLAGIALYFCVIFAYQVSLFADIDYVHLGARQLFKYHLAVDPNLLQDDYLTSYISAFDYPYLYDWMTRSWLWAGGDLTVLHRFIPLISWLLFLGGMTLAARDLGDPLTVIGTVGLTAAQPLYLLQMVPSLPHAFGFPLLIWAFVALLKRSAVGLALITMLSGLLYPAVTPLAGMLLAWQLIIVRQGWRQTNAARAKTLILLSAVGALSLWLVLDATSGPSNLGPALAPGQKADLYPENSPEGLPSLNLFSPLTYVGARASFHQFNELFKEHFIFFLFIYISVGFYGIFAFPRGSAGRRALFAWIACSVAVCLVILALRPHFLYRFVFYPTYTVLPLLFVVGLRQFCRSFERYLRFPDFVAMILLILFVLGLDSFNPKKIGYAWHLDAQFKKVTDFAVDQPADSLFAAWPGGKNRFEWIPYVARRPLLVMIYLHQPSHERHILEMRARMNALIDAYFATETTALWTLHCTWGVDFMIIEKEFFRDDADRPTYFAPFDARIEDIWQEGRHRSFLLRDPDPALVALETKDYFIVRLADINPTPSDDNCGARPSAPLSSHNTPIVPPG